MILFDPCFWHIHCSSHVQKKSESIITHNQTFIKEMTYAAVSQNHGGGGFFRVLASFSAVCP
jgi:hypothetical protein